MFYLKQGYRYLENWGLNDRPTALGVGPCGHPQAAGDAAADDRVSRSLRFHLFPTARQRWV